MKLSAVETKRGGILVPFDKIKQRTLLLTHSAQTLVAGTDFDFK
jgi:hypothetical protein